jgi:lipid A 3-O-deacylase
MRCFLFSPVVLLLLVGGYDRLTAQPTPDEKARQDTSTRLLLRIYDDNDCFDLRGGGTDDAYTNGTRIDVFYKLPHPARGFINRILPKAGDSSINIYGWGIMQLMFTPKDLSQSAYQPNDYPWSGALLAAHTLYSYNPAKKFDLQTELLLGVIGPASLASQTQTLIHRVEQYPLPMGWGHQFHDDLLLNINFTAEKQLGAWGSTVEVIGGSQLCLGTMRNSLALYPLIRIGLMNPYFQGYLSQYSNSGSEYSSPGSHTRSGSRPVRKWQAYLLLKPQGELVLTNALLEGGVFTGNPNIKNDKGPALPYHALSRMVYSMDYGAVASNGNFSVSFTQNASSAMMKGLYSHSIGNISLYFAW